MHHDNLKYTFTAVLYRKQIILVIDEVYRRISRRERLKEIVIIVSAIVVLTIQKTSYQSNLTTP